MKQTTTKKKLFLYKLKGLPTLSPCSAFQLAYVEVKQGESAEKRSEILLLQPQLSPLST